MVAGVRPDFPLSEVELLPPLLTPEKILCIGINYANRNADFNDPDVPKYPSMFYRHPGSLVGAGQSLVRPKVSEQFDYEGEIAMVIGREGRHIAKGDAASYIAGYTLCNEGTVRDWLRHGKFNVTQGKNFDKSGSLGPFIVTADEIDPAKPMHLTVKLNGEVTQDDDTSQHDLLVRRHHRLCDDLHDHQAGRHHRRRHAGQEEPQRSAALAQGRATSWRCRAPSSARCATPWSTKRRATAWGTAPGLMRRTVHWRLHTAHRSPGVPRIAHPGLEAALAAADRLTSRLGRGSRRRGWRPCEC